MTRKVESAHALMGITKPNSSVANAIGSKRG